MDMNYSPEGVGTLLILPGLLCDARMFAAQRAAFAGARVIDGFYDGADTIAGMADVALAGAPARFALLGHSMGARVALEIVRKAPERVERLALADTGVHGVREGEREARHRLLEIGRSQGAAALVDAWLPGMLGQAAGGDAALVASLRAMSIDAGVPVYAAQIAALLGRPPLEALLPRIACPTTVIVGEEDRWSPVAQHREIAASIPGARLHVVRGAGHMAPAENPRGFNEALVEWLADRPEIRSHANGRRKVS